jgi:hypothetical protein
VRELRQLAVIGRPRDARLRRRASGRFQTFEARQELAAFDRQLDAFFETPAGRFAVYDEERGRRRRAA